MVDICSLGSYGLKEACNLEISCGMLRKRSGGYRLTLNCFVEEACSVQLGQRR